MAIPGVSSAASAAVSGALSSTSKNTDGSAMFSDILDGLVSNVNKTDSSLNADLVKAAAGELDNPQQLLIDSSKASISLQLLTSVRNNALSAYEEITKMSL